MFRFLILIVLFLSSCSALDNLHDAAQDLAQAELQSANKRTLKEYTKSDAPYKVLIRTRDKVMLRGSTSWGVTEVLDTKYYYSLNQQTFAAAIIEASKYCQLDNPSFVPSEFCILSMVGDFSADEVEVESGKLLMEIQDTYFQVTIKNLNLYGLCFKRKYPSETIVEWKDCETNIRAKKELPKNLFKERKI